MKTTIIQAMSAMVYVIECTSMTDTARDEHLKFVKDFIDQETPKEEETDTGEGEGSESAA